MRRHQAALATTACVLIAVLAACSTPQRPPRPSDYVVLLESTDGTVGKVFVVGNKGAQTLDGANNGALMDGDSPIMTVSPEQIRQVFGAAMGARPALPEHFYLYFESGGLRLTAESEALIPTILQKAEDRESANISVIGHTDTVGRAEANAKLAFQRATNIASMLRGRGLQSATLTIESHGESNLLVPTPDETAEAKNRRVEINIR